MDRPAKLLTFGVATVIVIACIGASVLTRWWVGPLAAVAIVLAIYGWVVSLHLGAR